MHTELGQLYKSCGHVHYYDKIHALEAAASSKQQIIDRITRDIHSGKLKPGEVDEELMVWTAKQLMGGVTKGYGADLHSYAPGTQDHEHLLSLEKDVHVFSGFKTHTQLREATSLLHSKGKIKPFNEFKRDILALDNQYNKLYLKAEYNQAIASSQASAAWIDAQKSKEQFPKMRYETVGDRNVRPAHQVLNGIIKPLEDGFWDTHYPPNGWQCRCEAVKVLGSARTTTSKGWPAPPKMFATNVGKTGVVFPQHHPYYGQASKGVKQQVEKITEQELTKKVGKAKAGSKAIGTPVAEAFPDSKISRGVKPYMDEALKAIGEVHGDGVLPQITVKAGRGNFAARYGRLYKQGSRTVTVPDSITQNLKYKAGEPDLDLIHEVGHFIDHAGFDGTDLVSAELAEVRAVIRESNAIKELEKLTNKGSFVTMRNTVKPGETYNYSLTIRDRNEIRSYYLNDKEIWARAYCQYVATRCTNPALRKKLMQQVQNKIDDNYIVGDHHQWSAKDFEAIAKAIDKVMDQKGWRSK